MAQTKAEYLTRFAQNQRVEGFGLDTAVVYPCPFCAAPDWATHKILEMEEVMAQEHRCGECGRAAKMIFKRDASGVQFEFVQTAGDDAPEWLPPMRRVSGEE
jgi:hypothetical protein